MWSKFMYMLQSDNCLYLLTHTSNVPSLAHTLCIHRSQVGHAGQRRYYCQQDIQPCHINAIISPTIGNIAEHKGSVTKYLGKGDQHTVFEAEVVGFILAAELVR